MVPIELVPGAQVATSVRAATGELSPLLEITGRFCHGTAPEPRQVFRQTVARKGKALSFPVPAGCLDLSIAAPGFAAHRAMGLRVASGTTIRLDELVLVAAAQVSADVVARWNQRPLAGVRLALVPEDRYPDLAARALAGEDLRIWRGAPSAEDGTLTLAPVSAGRFGAILASDDPAVAREVLAPFTIGPGAKIDLGPIAMNAAAELMVQLNAKLQRRIDDLPGTWLWRAVVARPADCDARTGEAPARAIDLSLGSAVVAMAPGKWTVSLQLDDTDGRVAQIMSRDLDLAPGEAATVRFDGPVNLFAGTITHRDRPVQAEITLRGDSSERQDVPWTRSDEDGHFAVIVQHPGTYAVSVVWRAGGRDAIADLGPVLFEDEAASVDLEIPSGRIAGRVLDEGGQPVASAVVEAVRPGTTPGPTSHLPTPAVSGEDGAFSLDGLAPGGWIVEARRDRRVSEQVEQVLTDDREIDGLDLVLAPMRRIRGVLRSGGRPLAGLRGLLISPPSRKQPLGETLTFLTDSEGRYDVGLSSTEEARVLMMLPPPAPIVSSRWLQVTPEEQQVELGAPSSSLELRPSSGGWPAGLTPADLILVRPDGSAVWVVAPETAAYAPMSGSSSAWRVDNLEEGAWRVAQFLVTDGPLLMAGGALSLPTFGEAVLVAGTSAVIEVGEVGAVGDAGEVGAD